MLSSILNLVALSRNGLAMPANPSENFAVCFTAAMAFLKINYLTAP